LATTRKEQTLDEVTRLLEAIREGDGSARTRLAVLLYTELRGLARYYFAGERAGHTLQPTALVHEAFLRLVGQKNANWQDRAHFVASAAQVMRRILTDHARAKRTAKRGGAQFQITLDEGLAGIPGQSVDVLALGEAMDRLGRLDARQNQIVEMHFFGGLSFEEIGGVLNISARTAKRDWRIARAFLHAELSAASDTGA
jgi:RNA polymerase sigma-70 factor, ECF subfamily